LEQVPTHALFTDAPREPELVGLIRRPWVRQLTILDSTLSITHHSSGKQQQLQLQLQQLLLLLLLLLLLHLTAS
jgi:hypothetical protein